MEYSIDRNANKITLTATTGELSKWQWNDLKVWGCPDISGEVVTQVYVGNQKQFQDDMVLADYMDFLDAYGYSDLEEIEDQENADDESELFSITINRKIDRTGA